MQLPQNFKLHMWLSLYFYSIRQYYYRHLEIQIWYSWNICELQSYSGVKTTGINKSDHEVCWMRKRLLHLKHKLTYKTPFTNNFSETYLQGQKHNHNINDEILCSNEARPQLTLKKFFYQNILIECKLFLHLCKICTFKGEKPVETTRGLNLLLEIKIILET